MASTAFRQQVTQLLSELAKSHELCDAILTNRRLGNTHESFDRLQDGLKVSIGEIQAQFNLMRQVIGTKMDQGDDESLAAMENNLHNTQMEVRVRLFDLAYKKRDGRDSLEFPGFRELLRRWKIIEKDVAITFQGLGQRLQDKQNEEKRNEHKRIEEKRYEEHMKQEEKKREEREREAREIEAREKEAREKEEREKEEREKEEKKRLERRHSTKTIERNNSTRSTKSQKRDEDKKKPITRTYEVKPDTYDEEAEPEQVIVRLHDLDTLLKHMKNSWVEKYVGGDVLYINKFDSSKTQWEKPAGYIKPVPLSPRRSSTASSRDSRDSRRSSADSWELPQRRKSTRGDIWYDPNGW